MALPSSLNEILGYLPQEADFEAVFKAKQNGDIGSLEYYPYPKDEPYYYHTIKIYLAAILLRWEELGRKIENQLLGGKYEYINGVKTLIPYYTEKELATIRQWAMQYKARFIYAYMEYREASINLDSPEKLTKQARDSRKGEITVNIKDPNNIIRIIPYSMKYGDVDPNKKQTGAKMHIFFSKEIAPGKYSITVRGSTIFGDTKHPTYDQPYFLTEQEARDFINNFNHNTVDTKVTIEEWRFVITDRKMDDGYMTMPDGSSVKRYYMPTRADLTKVDTPCGPCYMMKKARDERYARLAANKKANKK